MQHITYAFSLFLYNIALKIYYLGAFVSAPFNQKASKWINGRKGVILNLKKTFNKDDKVIWVHASSLGEFEQGRPIIEYFKKEYPNIKILLTFFSPSGYEIRKNYEFADSVCYLPLDGKINAKKFISRVNPKMALFIKYDYWFYYFKQLKQENIPLFVVSALFTPGDYLFKKSSGFYSRILSYVTHFFVQDEFSADCLVSKGYNNVTVTNDTRIDRVLQIANNIKDFHCQEVVDFKGNEPLLIIGSAYETEIQFIKDFSKANPNKLKYLIVPHKVDPNSLEKIKYILPNAVFYSDNADKNKIENSSFYVIDTIGMLNKLYQYADIVMIGGGFNKSIHNTLEPAVFGKPILFGPKKHEKFREALIMIKKGGAFLVSDYQNFSTILTQLFDAEFRKTKGQLNLNYILNSQGGTVKIVNILTKYLE